MPNQATMFDADGTGLVEHLREKTDGELYSVVEYDKDEFNLLYVADTTRSFYEDDEQMHDHFEEIHSYVHLDFVEMDLFTDRLFPLADRVEYITTRLDFMKLVRFYVGDRGLFVSVEPDEPIVEIAEIVRESLDRSGDA